MEEELKKREVLKRIDKSYPVALSSQIGAETNIEPRELGQILGELEQDKFIIKVDDHLWAYRITDKGIEKIKKEE